MKITEIMSPNVATVQADELVSAAAATMRRKKIHHLVVMQDKAVVGILSARDIADQSRGSLHSDYKVSEFMNYSVVSAPSTTTIKRAANLMRGHVIGCLPIIDKQQLVGIVTIADLLEYVGRSSEKPVQKGKRWRLKSRGPRPAERAV